MVNKDVYSVPSL